MSISVERLIRELSQPSAYPSPPGEISVVQTHISVIFLTPRLVYKVKKPVDFGFLDFTDLEKRLHYCREELRLNRRLSPDLYLEVLPVTEGPEGLRFGGEGEALEYAVVMKRLPGERILSCMLAQGTVDEGMIRTAARKIAHFHLLAEGGEEITRIGGREAVETNTEENFQQIAPYVGSTLDQDTFHQLQRYTRTFREVNAPLFERRELEGWIRDGHGDLHTQHLCFSQGLQIFDCIEFNQRFRYSDVLCDAAFLGMDLERLGETELAGLFARSYLDFTGQRGVEPLYNFYACYRAVVRGKVEGFRSRDRAVKPEEAQEACSEAAAFFRLALRYARTLSPPTLFATCGLMGSGKSTLARGLCRRLELEHLSSDQLRKELAGIPLQEKRHVPFGEDIYRAEHTGRTYDELFARAARALEGGRSALLDASFTDPAMRRRARQTAEKAGTRFVLLWLDPPEEELRERLRGRAVEETVSDGRSELLATQASVFQPPDRLAAGELLHLRSGDPQEQLREAYRHALATS